MNVAELTAFLNNMRADVDVVVQVSERLDAGDDLLTIKHATTRTWYTHPDTTKPDTVRHDEVVLIAETRW